jgi:hypothetical protein
MARDDAELSTETRLFNSFLRRGFTPGEALSMAKQEVERRADEELQAAQKLNTRDPGRADYDELFARLPRSYPRSLDNTRASDSDLPGFDPTAREFSPEEAADAAARKQQQGTLYEQMYGRSPAMTSEEAARASSFATAGKEPAKPWYDLSFQRKAPAAAPTYDTGSFKEQRSPSIIDRAISVLTPPDRPVSSASAAPSAVENREAPPVAPPAAVESTAPARTSLPMMTRPMTAPDNIGQGTARFGVPYARDTEGATSNMPVRLGSDDYLRFAMDKAAPSASLRVAPSSSAAPLPPRRPATDTAAPTESGSSISNLLGKIFSGNDYQSTGQRVVDDKGVNWGSSESPSDFFRADKARMQRQSLSSDTDEGKKRGGAVGGKDAAMHKALEIIHHLLMRQR